MAAKKSVDKHGRPIHYSAGAIIEQDGKILLEDRAIEPWGLACPAGHVDENESFESAVRREVAEETGLKVESVKLVLRAIADIEQCSKNVLIHEWQVFSCTVSGEIKPNERESKSIKWYDKSELSKLPLEKVWREWFERLGYL